MASQDQNKANTDLSLFAIATPGLESFTAQELERLGVAETEAIFGGVSFRGPRSTLYRTNLHLRTASRVLVRFGTFRATKFPELRRKASHLSWETFLRPGQAVTLRTTSHRSRLIHQRAVTERVLGAIQDRLGQAVRPVKASSPESTTAQLILVRLMHDECMISIDSSGPLLHQRGYRLATAKAPLRETVAAGMILASGWDRHSPFLDPFCGSGTIAIEAALMAKNLLPGSKRRFAFMEWPDFDQALWQSLLAEIRPASDMPLLPILASDRDRGAVEAARENAGRAGVMDSIGFSCRSISAIEPPFGPGWVVTNPPYGVRVSRTKDLRDLYAAFGGVLREKCPGWNVTIFSPNASLERATGLGLGRATTVITGGLKLRLVTGQVPA